MISGCTFWHLPAARDKNGQLRSPTSNFLTQIRPLELIPGKFHALDVVGSCIIGIMNPSNPWQFRSASPVAFTSNDYPGFRRQWDQELE